MPIQHKELKKQEIVTRRPVKSKVCADKKCQATKYYEESDKNCQTDVMWPVKPPMDVQLKEPIIRRVHKDKNCQAKICYTKQKKCENIDPKSHVSRNSYKNCQEIKKPRKPRSDMQSVTNTDVQLHKTTISSRTRTINVQDATSVQ